MQAPNLIQFPDQLTRLESEAQNYLDKSLEAFRQFVDTLQVIQDSGLFSQYGTWDKYLRTRWGIAESTFRGYRAQSNTAEIMLSVVDSTVTKAEAAKVSRILSKLPQESLRLEAYAKAYKHTGKVVPSEMEIAIAYDMIERVKSKRVYTINGEDIDANTLDDVVIDNGIIEAYGEKKKRQSLYIDASMGIESKRLAIQQNEAVLALFQVLGVDMPQGHDFVLFWKEKVGD